MNFSGLNNAFAATAGTILATVWQHDTLPQSRIQDGLSFIDAKHHATIAVFDFKLLHLACRPLSINQLNINRCVLSLM